MSGWDRPRARGEDGADGSGGARSVPDSVAEQRLLNVALAGQLERARMEMESLKARVRSYEEFPSEFAAPVRLPPPASQPVETLCAVPAPASSAADFSVRGAAPEGAEAGRDAVHETRAGDAVRQPPAAALQPRDDDCTEYSVGAGRIESKKAQSRYWKPDEHARFLEAIDKFGPRDVRAISKYVCSRSPTQVRTHAQKYFLRLAKEASGSAKSGPGGVTNIEIIRNVSDGDLTKLGREIAAARAIKLRQSIDSGAAAEQHPQQCPQQRYDAVVAPSPLSISQRVAASAPTSHDRMAVGDSAMHPSGVDPEQTVSSGEATWLHPGSDVFMVGSTCGISLLSLVASQTDAQ
mmetsp:Transcript_12876/g.34689  ORF Transcript_12876/g.34689 Transcript_12876/m.34689 type:complete len:350 (+) Transcript_12876:190-1239(+)